MLPYNDRRIGQIFVSCDCARTPMNEKKTNTINDPCASYTYHIMSTSLLMVLDKLERDADICSRIERSSFT